MYCRKSPPDYQPGLGCMGEESWERRWLFCVGYCAAAIPRHAMARHAACVGVVEDGLD